MYSLYKYDDKSFVFVHYSELNDKMYILIANISQRKY